MTKVALKILPRPEVLDSQGRACEQSLARENFASVQVRVGKYIELEFELGEQEALNEAEKMAKWGLYNPLIETFQLEVVRS